MAVEKQEAHDTAAAAAGWKVAELKLKARELGLDASGLKKKADILKNVIAKLLD